MKRDPVENTEKYKLAMRKIGPKLKEEFPDNSYYLGCCHSYWKRKKELLLREGVRWKTPAELNPDIRFD